MGKLCLYRANIFHAMKTTTNATTQAIILILTINGFKAWRTNNGAIYNQKTKGFQKSKTRLLGVPDILAFHKRTGLFCCVEVKTGRDVLSESQKLFINDAKASGAIAIVAKTSLDFEEQFKSFANIPPDYIPYI